ncbi:putative tricarboxylate carrier [Trypanosoma cruzi]|uniref:Tricarboxylate carrier, putative n=3 Tax=Trypanosoma cruzi TaxID=5693 RepID=Q4CVF7_TRYCC|nr:tricarboxylate carrier, putative [Trypanosoma cruzi]ESS65394.1 tricarboxylate carrier [Trypanosoma cruzi Dm28c]PBJ74891.1 tricarboxylate carrier [Trypanosoma cruzi cruzi]EAN84262.1 tricarboxylate carrier, putative [Trypanosoma cruzi]KAF8280468.1 putative tricarboxylate carrier [Trypanosoma cruzi]PWU87751.1 putative tricarboxylate carrier [Trypanosoma cruzi]|eukprot:XP_806113.1 tricarboxylate carrier [Trypanosoma cruzi strain CL Brener]
MFSYPPFSLTKPMYDTDTYIGRSLYFFFSINPLLCFQTERMLMQKRLLLDRVAAGEKVSVDDKTLWKARMAIENCVHPTTGEVIFPLFRMCAFLPMNSLIVPFMMTPGTVSSVARTVFIQWFNQSYNSAVNYANRSSEKQKLGELSKAYVAAVGISVSGALGATALLKRVPSGTLQATVIRATLPCLAVSAAAIVNLSLMRKNEWMSSGQGLKVVDEDGEVRGYSLVAGMDSLKKCSVTRVVWNIPSMFLPTLLMAPLTARFGFARAYPICTETALQIAGLAVGVPAALGAFSTTVSIPANRLETSFQDLKRKDGTPVKMYTYYKGL